MLQKKYHINKKEAEETLQDILTANNQEQSESQKRLLTVFHRKSDKRIVRMALFGILLIAGLVLALLLYMQYIKSVPTEPMSLSGDYVEDQRLYLTINTGGHRISLQKSYLRTIDGMEYSPISYDKSASVICFPYPDTECNIYIIARDGSQLHLLLSPDKENSH